MEKLIFTDKAIVKLNYGLDQILFVNTLDFVGQEFMDTGAFEKNIYCLIKHYSFKKGISVDIGSHYGHFSLSLAGGGALKVISYEPNSNIFTLSRASFLGNGYDENVISPHNLALSDKEEYAYYYQNDSYTWADGVISSHNYNKGYYLDWKGDEILLDKKNVIIIKTSTLDVHLKKMGISTISFIRLDAEGSECKIILGALNTIKLSLDLVISLEWQAPIINNVSPDSEFLCLDKLSQLGFHFYSWEANTDLCSIIFKAELTKEEIIDNNSIEILVTRETLLVHEKYNHIDEL